MTKQLQRDLDQVQQSLLALGASVETAIYDATQALLARDIDLARQVVDGDDDIDLKENSVESECLKVLARHQPVASDLRRVCSAMIINMNLERMGDLAVSIAQRVLALSGHECVPVPEEMNRMITLTLTMVRRALESYRREESRSARFVCRSDDEVDRANDECIQDVVASMKADPALIESGMSMFSAVRHLERIADHATNIAEEVIYLVEGEIVRHRPEAILAAVGDAERPC